MSEIIYTETVKHRDFIDKMESGRTISDVKTNVWASPTKVSVTKSWMVVGVPRGETHKNKRYYYWITTESMGFYTNSAGKPQPYHARRPWDAKRQTPWQMGGAQAVFTMLGSKDSEYAQAFTHEVWKTFGFDSLEGMYPIAGKYGLPSYNHIPYIIRPAMREPNWEAFTVKAFGKTRASLGLVAAVSQSEPYLVAYAHQFKGLVPDRNIEAFLLKQKFDDEMMEKFELHNPNIRRYLKAMNEDSRKSILSCGLDLDDTKIINYLAGGHSYRLKCIDDGILYRSWDDVWSGNPNVSKAAPTNFQTPAKSLPF